MQKSEKALLETQHDIVLKMPDLIVKEFFQAAELIKKRFGRSVSYEQLMIWTLSGITSDQLVNEFQIALNKNLRK
ncbi:MAG: hypothetical protein R3F23_04375 [Verrucomicrobiia bacterium]